jgi:DtxR family transcriptional regulator, Mn-dependent transcriptional regulator
MMLSQHTENYLKTIFSLTYSLDTDIVKTTEISKRLGISPPAVTDMIKKMEREALVVNTPYKGVSLTEKGRTLGCKILRQHRLWESYLNEVLNMPWDMVHEEAERLEHACSDYLIEKIDTALDFPKFDPHGNPIPDKDGHMIKIKDECKLSDCKPGDSCYILRVVDMGEQFLKYLNSLSITLKTKIEIVDILSLDSSLICLYRNQKISLSKLVCDHIYVIKHV